MDRLYFEDLTVGYKKQLGSVQVTESEALEFARRYDPQPMHIDPEAAGCGPFGGIIASGWLTAALMMRLQVDARVMGDTPMLGMGLEDVRWPVAVRPGDVLTGEAEVVAMTPSKSKPGFGIIKVRVTGRNQKGEVVFISHPNCWVPRRPSA